MQKREILLPPQIQQLINGLNYGVETPNVQNNYKDRLKDIISVIQEQIDIYERRERDLPRVTPKRQNKYKKQGLNGVISVNADRRI